MNNNSYLLILIKEYLNNKLNSITNNFNYEIYTIEGEKINNLSICENINIEVSSPIKNSNLINYDKALALYQQGFDIYNLSSSFYYDVCLSAYINNSDLSVDVRQQEIYPYNVTLCQDGCTYNGIDYEKQRINCTCNPNNNISEKIENIPNFMEEVEQNFFSYIVDMINYKIIGCYYKIFDINNYI